MSNTTQPQHAHSWTPVPRIEQFLVGGPTRFWSCYCGARRKLGLTGSAFYIKTLASPFWLKE